MKTFFIIAFGLHAYVCCAQVVEHFDDENFSSNPLWSGTSAHFIVNASQQLQLSNTIAGTSYLSTPFVADTIDGFEWEAYVKQAFAPSGSNYGRIYLVSDQSDLTAPLNGYYLQLGEAGSLDAVELFRQSGSTHTPVCRATNAAIALSFAIRLKVTRSSSGTWTLLIDYAGGTNFVEEANGTDTTFSQARYFGVVCLYTASNASRFFFDDLITGPPLGDLSPPLLTGLAVVSQSELELEFSEVLDSTSISVTNFIVSDSIENPSTTELLNEQKSVRLTFSSAFLNGKGYTLSISRITDLASNEMPPEERSFRYFVPEAAANSDIIFNELFTDPSPIIGLPGYEFVELFNRSQKAFDLSGWTLSDLTSTATLPTTFILPNEYLVITATAALSLYQQYGPTLGITEMPTLNNSSDALVLRDPSGNIIDSVHYSLSWFQDEDKQLGGYTLERLQPDLETNEPLNWMASESLIGGTPGSPNSVLGRAPDSKAPTVDTLMVVNQNTLALIFNEALDSASLQSSAFKTSMGLVPSSVTIISHVVIELGFAEYFGNGPLDYLVVTGIKDIVGNVMDTTNVEFRYFIEGQIVPGVVLINEIMADPSPTVQLPEAEYIEVFNISDSPFDLQGWTLTDATDTIALPAAIILPHEHLVLASTTNAVKFSVYGRQLGVPGFPLLTNSGEPLTLRSPAGTKIDSVFYHQAWLGQSEKADGGWSLERLSSSVASTEPTNWRAAVDPSGGTPGRVNSVAGMNPDATSPTLDSLFVRSDHELSIVFNEPMDSVAGTHVEHFLVDGRHPVEATVSGLGAEVSLAFETAFENGVDQQLLVFDLRDLAGNEMDTTEISFRYFVPGEISAGVVLINEVMADPSPTVQLPEAEYIEIVNTSDLPFDLLGWTLTDATDTVTLPSGIILPHEYLVLTSTTNATKFSVYGPRLGVPGFPSLANAGEPMVLRSSAGVKIDSVFFHQAWLGGSEKVDGGWSLERLSLSVVSNEPTNWRASVDTLGGTPARVNSVAGMNPDSKSPTLDSLQVRNDQQLDLVFDEAMDSLVGARVEHYTLEGSHPAVAEISIDGTKISLRFDGAFENGIEQELFVHGLRDLAGNEMDTAQASFRYFVSGEINAGVVLINEIMADPSPTVQLPEAEYVEVVNTTDTPFDLCGWTLVDATDTVALPPGIILPHEYLVLTSTTNSAKFAEYGRHLGIAGFPSLTNSGEPLTLRSSNGVTIDSLFYHQTWLGGGEKADGGWSLERLSLSAASHEPTNWRASIDTIGGTPARMNSVAGMNPDATSPKLDSLFVRGFRELDLGFNEIMDSVTATNVEHYLVDGRHPVVATVPSLGTEISLAFETVFGNGIDQQLLVFGLKDLAGNCLDTTEISFRYFVPGETGAGVVLINEIMADPSPVVQLPEAEFIELVNVSMAPFNLEGWMLSDATTTCLLPKVIIQAGEILVLTSTGNALKFDTTYRVVGVTGFPSLNNSEESIQLSAPDGLVVDSLHYGVTWFGDDPKQDGGWSLERLRYNFSSSAQINWRLSLDPRGGTPGTTNSQFGKNPDDQPPQIVSAMITNPRAIQLRFNEPIDEAAIGTLITVDSAEFDELEWVAANEVHCKVANDLENGRLYAISVVGVKDTAGNVMPATELTLRYFVPSEVNPKDVIINEIMPDPSPMVGLPEAEYIELFNRGTSPINLSGWKLADATTTASLPERIIMPDEFLVVTSSGLFQQRNSLVVVGLPSLGNDGDHLVLRAPNGVRVDSINYNKDWYRASEKLDGGWSLELIDPLNPCGEQDNWAACEDESGGTPGRINSVQASKPDITGPAVVRVVIESSRSILIEFDEKLNDEISGASVSLIPGAGHLSLAFADAALKSIRVTADEELKLSTPYVLSVANLFDCNGNRIRDEHSGIRFTLPEDPLEGDIVINEVLFNPRPGGPDFIEIYNKGSRYIDLKGWRIARRDDGNEDNIEPINENHLLAPQTFLVFTTDRDRLLSDYPQAPGDVIIEVSLPSMPDDHAALAINDSRNNTLDSLNYDESLHSALISDPEGVSLERISMEVSASESSNWRSAAESAGYATPGQINSNSRGDRDESGDEFFVSPEVISKSGADNFAMIFYRFNEPGKFINCRVFDQQGHLIKEIANNTSVGIEGFLRWDGDSKEGGSARAGYYIVLLDYFDAEGAVNSVRMRVIVAPR